jgi:hypothetical protein
MGYKARLKQIRKLFKDNKRPKSITDLIVCPYCRAYGYPRKWINPKNDTEKEAILCPSCQKDLVPYIKKKQEEAEAKEKLKNLKQGESIMDIVKNAPVEIYEKEKVNV